VKRTIAIKLDVSAGDFQILLELQEKFSQACDKASEIAVKEEKYNRIQLHHLAYYTLRTNFSELGFQMCCNAIAKTAQVLQGLKRRKQVHFKKEGSVHFDKRTYSLKNGMLSLFTLRGRIRLALAISPFHQNFLNQGKMKEAELVRKNKRWFFHLVLDLPDVPIQESRKGIYSFPAQRHPRGLN
jgi:predicted transposase